MYGNAQKNMDEIFLFKNFLSFFTRLILDLTFPNPLVG